MSGSEDLRERIRESFGPAMRLGLQDAELHDEPGAQRIEEWITAITDAVYVEVSSDIEQLKDELDDMEGALVHAAGLTDLGTEQTGAPRTSLFRRVLQGLLGVS